MAISMQIDFAVIRSVESRDFIRNELEESNKMDTASIPSK